MSKIAVCALLLAVAACGDNSYTWGDVTAELAADFCQSYADHCVAGSFDVGKCETHVAWSLCDPAYYDCYAEVDSEAAAEALDECRAAMNPPKTDDYALCYVYRLGFLPSGCDGVWALDPGPQDPG